MVLQSRSFSSLLSYFFRTRMVLQANGKITNAAANRPFCAPSFVSFVSFVLA
jgi:hypothetical protein